VLYVTYANTVGPNGGEAGSVWKYSIANGTWTEITPEKDNFGFSGLSVDLQKPGTLVVAALNKWWPDTREFHQ
jgi:xyloglucan-specific exo-beta-1,4-glucanase